MPARGTKFQGILSEILAQPGLRRSFLAIVGSRARIGGAPRLRPHGSGYLDACVRLSEPRLRTDVAEQVLRHDTEIEP